MLPTSNLKRRTQRKQYLLIATFLLLLLTISATILILYTSNTEVKPTLKAGVHVNSEAELRTTIENTPTNTPVVIVLDNDITLTDGPLNIDDGMDVTLTSNKASGFYKLIGVKESIQHVISDVYKEIRYATITVSSGGVFRLDGIIVTHAEYISGEGVSVSDGGTFVLYDGEISGNNNNKEYLGHGGFIGHSGGGVINCGVFEMYGGKITNNTADNGGGIYNNGNFTESFHR